MKEPAFTVGIEEEYLLVDRATGELAKDPPAAILAECERRLAAQGQAGQVSPEFLRAQGMELYDPITLDPWKPADYTLLAVKKD